MRHRGPATIVFSLLLLLLSASTSPARELPKELQSLLESSTYVYISSTRKDGTLSRPAEIWFMWHKSSLYVASSPQSWRARRIRWGRAQAKIWIGKPDGPSFTATGAIVDEPDIHPILFDTYAKKYPDRWKRWEQDFREGLKNGSRVLIRYTPS